jgi:hypothetical protein
MITYSSASRHHCWTRDQLQKSEKRRSFVPMYNGIVLGSGKCPCTSGTERQENMFLLKVALTDVQKLAQNRGAIDIESLSGYTKSCTRWRHQVSVVTESWWHSRFQWWLNPSSFCSLLSKKSNMKQKSQEEMQVRYFFYQCASHSRRRSFHCIFYLRAYTCWCWFTRLGNASFLRSFMITSTRYRPFIFVDRTVRMNLYVYIKLE